MHQAPFKTNMAPGSEGLTAQGEGRQAANAQAGRSHPSSLSRTALL